MKILSFYKKVIDSLRLSVTSDGYIKSDEKNIIIDSKPMVIPSKQQLESLTAIDEYGTHKLTKVLFNPLKENLVRKDSIVIQRIKKYVELNINFQAIAISELLLKLGETKDIKDLPLSLNQFSVLLEATNNKSIEKLIDPSLLNSWKKLTDETLSNSNYKIIKVYLRKNVKKEGETYYRGLVISSPLLDMLESGDTPFKLRGKDIRVFKVVINYIMASIANDEDNIVAASNNELSPTFMVLVKGYKIAIDHLNKILKDLDIIDKKVSKECMLEIFYTFDDLDFSKYESELVLLPEITEDGINEVDQTMHGPDMNSLNQQMGMDSTSSIPTLDESSIPVNNTDEMTEEEVKKMLYGNTNYIPPTGYPQQNMGGGQPMYIPSPAYTQQQPFNPVMAPQPCAMPGYPQPYSNPNMSMGTQRMLTPQQQMIYNQQRGIPFDPPYAQPYR